jgi:hypothetical protein
MIRLFLNVITAIFIFQASAAAAMQAHLALLLGQFKRQFTLIEVGGGDAAFSITRTHRSFGVALLPQGEGDDLLRECAASKNPLMIVLRPQIIDDKRLKRFGECEHVDIALVHEASIQPPADNHYRAYADTLLALADYSYIETANSGFMEELRRRKLPVIEESEGRLLFYSQCQKTGLERARYTQDKEPGIQYQIISSFTEKYFKKPMLPKPTQWIHGINLMTFAMLGGIYPSDSHICKQIEMMPDFYTDHSDLVLGNMIMQGTTLIAIDIKDSRRSSRSSRCIQAALNAFKPGNNRLLNPERWAQDYFQALPT